MALVTDTASNMVAAARLTGWKHIPCFAHTLNLIVQAALSADPVMADLKKKCKSIVTTVAHRCNARNSIPQHKSQFYYTKLNSQCTKLNSECTKLNSTTQNLIRNTQNSILLHKTYSQYTKLNSQYTKLNSRYTKLNSQYTKLNSQIHKTQFPVHKTQFAIIHDSHTGHVATPLIYCSGTIYSISAIFLVCFYNKHNERKVPKMWRRIRLFEV